LQVLMQIIGARIVNPENMRQRKSMTTVLRAKLERTLGRPLLHVSPVGQASTPPLRVLLMIPLARIVWPENMRQGKSTTTKETVFCAQLASTLRWWPQRLKMIASLARQMRFHLMVQSSYNTANAQLGTLDTTAMSVQHASAANTRN